MNSLFYISMMPSKNRCRRIVLADISVDLKSISKTESRLKSCYVTDLENFPSLSPIAHPLPWYF